VASATLRQAESIKHSNEEACTSSSILCMTPPSPKTEAFFQAGNRLCTSYRLKIAQLKNPVDMCVLPNAQLVVADYDNGIFVLAKGGDVVRHLTVADDKAACGVVASPDGSRLVVLGYKVG